MGNGQESLSLFSQQGLKCLCLAPAWPQLQTPSSISIEGAVDVMQDPAELKMGRETSVSSGHRLPLGVGNSCRRALETPGSLECGSVGQGVGVQVLRV